MSEQLEFSFMKELRAKNELEVCPAFDDVDTFEQTSIVALFDNAFDETDELFWELKRHECWNYPNDKGIEVLVFEDTSAGKFYRAERLVNNPEQITNYINSYEIYGCEMLELPEVHWTINDAGKFAWVYK